MDIDRVMVRAPSELTVTFYADETATDADGDVQVQVENAAGDAVTDGVATLAEADSGTYRFALPAQPHVANLTVSWGGTFGGETVIVQTYVEVVGGQFFTLSELRNFDSVLANTTKYPTERLLAARNTVETDFERMCGRAFVPRYARETLRGAGEGHLWLSHPEPLEVLSVAVDGDETWADERVIRADRDNLRILVVEDAVWPSCTDVIIEYTYGRLFVPQDIKRAALKFAKYRLVSDVSRIDERATSMNIPDFGTFSLATPGFRGSLTGIPDVDVVLSSYVLGGIG